MSEAMEKGLVPGLRFPEFRDAGEWEKKRLADIAEFYKGKGISKADIQPNGNQPCIRYGELYTIYGELIDNVISKTDMSPNELFLSHTGDVVIPSSGETKIDIATAACVMRKNVALGSDLNVIRSKQNGVFLSYYLNGALKFEIAKVAQGDTVAHLYKSNLEKLDLAIPPQIEQQKIADCLSSIDELITAQAQKVEAVKAHKKGLMQQLFPAEGETVPKLRFPEFRNAGDWNAIPLGQLAKRCKQKNGQGKLNRVLTNSAEFGVIDQRDFFDKYIANQSNLEGYFVVEKGDYVYNPRISTTAPVGPISRNNVAAGVMSPLYIVFRFNNNQNDFYSNYFKTTGWHQYMRQASSTGARHDRMAIANGDFMAMPLPVTRPEEQQKIADCLSSIDDLITAQTQKLTALKAHKKGLMQQLFPAVDEIVG
ncbi:restriction endonuclease subunit S [Candidatus Methylobacter oryzae]|uniref:Restriction endonuclease subunit S n=1 Tax=Candidatus Methylobacter oryzae TaxID=2497749 RepID=A0ABY3CGT1_9GAMM|nr:restriction endonuclease subunit S [Candidatus Methylobacter oryzae]TRX03247.1 restriction endonuclease subunit S [Candidatus Methylobacter oryzae]